MQKHEIVMMQWTGAVLALVLGLCVSFTLAGYPPLPFPAGIIHGFTAAVHDPLLFWGVVPGAVLAAGAAWAYHEYLFNGFEGYRYAKFIRGTKMENRHQLSSRIARHNNQYRKQAVKHGDAPRVPVAVCGVEMPTDLETQNLIVVGAPGSGKSQAINGLIASALRRDDRMVVVDPNGSLMSRFYLPGDIVINPYDARCVGWSLFNEVDHGFDFERLAHSAIPPQNGDQAEEWAGYARALLADTMNKLAVDDMRDMVTLTDLLVREQRPVLQKYLEDTDSVGFFAKDADRATASIIFTLNKYIRPLRRIPDGDFSIRRWMGDENAGNIWITWREDQRTALGPTIPVWLDLIYAMILSEAPTFDRRLWVFKNELASLGRLYSFEAAVSKGRKHGLCVVGDLQDLVQLHQQLGDLPAKATLSCFRSLLALGGANALTTKSVAEMIGWHEVERHPIGVQGQWRINTRERKRDPELVVTSSQLSNLPDLNGYLKYGKDWPLAKIRFGARDYPVRVPAYIEATPCEVFPSIAVPAPVNRAPAPQGEPGAAAIIIGTVLPSTQP
ncbi:MULTISPECIES: type IV secretion system DNA-binding domain-containing protein [Paraburkholderia]|uniref:type IV secretion system DNA-binding domain-containing protein n=1 Tax=Paraburkholderia TaxID=1822464 RepID=UPI002252773F|nr:MULTISPECIES: type IV secretion system DNA-binding domain-containing protein [Paraburkholderia]MCX4159323.1 type IV secretion system DNA-binding domain-containing protein [Paraburkholderia aspalathi]MDN7168722.1 type IV secretion system DNA-binding domain-containing protein [Paraburkholderia sp. SECH2]MDQ6397209.1 type IV secretion system DNA-binding domain-containing protein [Paraburkholderia aspalathi]